MKNLTKYVSAAVLAFSLAATAGCASTSTKESTGEYVDDSIITTKVKALILKDETLKTSTEINVETFKGIVQLSGFVSSPAAQSRAVDIASKVSGVKSVKNDMRLK